MTHPLTVENLKAIKAMLDADVVEDCVKMGNICEPLVRTSPTKEPTVKCPTCVAEGKTSRIHIHSGARTCMGVTYFYDEDGAYHCHDPNFGGTYYVCSNLHMWDDGPDRCPVTDCEWNKNKPVAAVASNHGLVGIPAASSASVSHDRR